MDIQIIAAAHKACRMPNDSMYLPVHAGKALHTQNIAGFQGDDTGENISRKNKQYCELTALYWAWKNVQADYLGLVHYRRFFRHGCFGKWNSILKITDGQRILSKYDVILPKKRYYMIESTYSHYCHAHHAQDLDIVRDLIQTEYPAYQEPFSKVMKSSSGHRCNMFIMKRSLADAYCQWLFDILFRLEKRLDITGYSEYDARVFGFVAERLLDVWVTAHHISYAELPVVYMEKQNWLKKGFLFLKRKFDTTGEKYERCSSNRGNL